MSSKQDDIFNNEPRNRRGADFSRSNPIPDWPKSNRPAFGSKSTFSVSDIRRSFENGNKESEKPLPPKKPPTPGKICRQMLDKVYSAFILKESHYFLFILLRLYRISCVTASLNFKFESLLKCISTDKTEFSMQKVHKISTLK